MRNRIFTKEVLGHDCVTVCRDFGSGYQLQRESTIPPRGFEHAHECSTFNEPAKCAAPCAGLGAEFGPIDPELATVVDAWPSLSEAVRAKVVATVRTALGAG